LASETRDAIRQPAELRFARELRALEANEPGPLPPGWRLSPRSVRTFLLGSGEKALEHELDGARVETVVSQKYYGDDALVDRSVVTLLGNRALMLIGEPGTAKSMLSELLAAAISGSSIHTIQGSAGTTEDQIRYSWNYALLLSEGPSRRALVAAPLYIGLSRGVIVRFEEMTRCPPEIQDTLISVLSDKILQVPELGDDALVLGRPGFNVVATANVRDRGVHEMSSALKRRFNFETVHPIADKAFELKLVKEQTEYLLHEAQTKIEMPEDVVDLLVTTFQDLRRGRTEEGTIVERPSTVMSTAEAVSVGLSAALDAAYLGEGIVEPQHLVRQLVGTAVKGDEADAKKIRQYFDVVVKARSSKNRAWKRYYEARRQLER
jgi:MoxR-like ATPase